jgi:hypothetical protein
VSCDHPRAFFMQKSLSLKFTVSTAIVLAGSTAITVMRLHDL